MEGLAGISSHPLIDLLCSYSDIRRRIALGCYAQVGVQVSELKAEPNTAPEFRQGPDCCAVANDARHLLLADLRPPLLPQPNIDIQDKAQRTSRVLSDPEASAQLKFQALEDLAKSGGKQLDFVDLDGTNRHFRLEYEKFQSNGLIHVYAEEDGKDRIVLRAVCNQDGSYSLEANSKGQPISFYGSWWTANKVGKSFFAPSGVFANDLQPDSPEINELFDKVAKAASGKPGKLQQLSNGSVYFRAKMDVDADGSPRAKEIDPKNGDLNTSLRYPDGSPVNAETMPYFVMPGGKYLPLHIDKGDLAAVRYKGVVRFPVFADVGPPNKLGEGSIELASELNIPNSPVNGGIQTPDVEYIVFPGSGDKTPGTKDGNAVKALDLLRKYSEKHKK